MINFEELIKNGIKNLPPESLKEIAEFVFFIRKKIYYPEVFLQEFEHDMLRNELKELDERELQHLEDEFKNYKTSYPFE